MSASEDLGNLLKVLEEHLGGDSVAFDGEGFANFYAILLSIKRQVVELENGTVPLHLRNSDPRICKEPPWGFASNVVSIDAARQQNTQRAPS